MLKQMDKLCKGQDVAAKALFWVKVPEQAGKPLDSSVKKNSLSRGHVDLGRRGRRSTW